MNASDREFKGGEIQMRNIVVPAATVTGRRVHDYAAILSIDDQALGLKAASSGGCFNDVGGKTLVGCFNLLSHAVWEGMEFIGSQSSDDGL